MSRQLNTDIGRFHFVGIGGIGMSGIAELMYHLGYTVSGSDQSASANLDRLAELGINVMVGHDSQQISEAQFVVRSTAVQDDNPEIATARALGIPVVHRAEMLAEMMHLKSAIAVAGTHGKTTTTSLISHLLEKARLNPTVINGGIINAYGSNAKVGTGEWMVVEADESDGSFTKLPHVAGVITNIDPEHLDHYGDFSAVQRAFYRFANNIPFFGFLVLCTDHPEVQALRQQVNARHVISYGLNPHADIRADNIRMHKGQQMFDVHVRADYQRAAGQAIADDVDIDFSFAVRIPLPGHHNVCNALAAIAVARQLGVSVENIARALQTFGGVRRRFQLTGKMDDIDFIDDYAHHPTEISAALQAARSYCTGRIIAVFQPHRYSRLSHLYDDFLQTLNQCDTLLVMPVYAAGEAALEDIDSDRFVADITARGHTDAHSVVADVNAMARLIVTKVKDNDIVICMGAGSITTFAHALPEACCEIMTQSGN